MAPNNPWINFESWTDITFCGDDKKNWVLWFLHYFMVHLKVKE